MSAAGKFRHAGADAAGFLDGGDTLARLAAVARGELRARDWLEQCIARVDAVDDRVNAFTLRTLDRARREADAIDARRAAGETLPPLAGLPYAVKNLYDIDGEVTVAGSRINREHAPAAADAALVQRLREAGAVLVGALNMDEYAYGFTTENTHDGPVRNPHDPRRIAGGSSGGSGAAVAAGQVPVTLGSDTNGSIRVPASLCGVWGLKPTFGRLSRRGTYPFVHSIDHLGPFADSATLLARVYDALQFVDARDPACHARAVQPVAPVVGQGVQGLRVGVLDGYFDDNATDPARAAVRMAGRALGSQGLVEWPDAGLARVAAFIITASEGGSLHLDDLRRRADDFEPLSVDRFIAGALQPAHWVARAHRFRRVYRERVLALFRRWDVLLAPATPVSALPIGTEWLDVNGATQPARAAMGLLTQPVSFAGCPVVAAPLWPDGTEGLPLGVQVIAAPWREDLALRAARALERAGVAGLRRAAL
ncbi:AtzE family amidohydrolase [Achromobacter aloeverae]|uniref:AtzE family amidohydrolase n=1 Tax=Achromobacter aloeverae TaxID=1750518 RepID=A0A4Q1HP05_9BURK|nr:AtzE family amidohydrolase [Achromobacter aloeverae]RXN92629.1 AtzE family amidohydrolase [Achromobacter aloeverae]